MELRNIHTFLRVAELRSFSRAASQLGYSQSAVTAQIRLLETELDVPLFDRVNKTVRLTDAGERLIAYARTLVRTEQQALAALQHAPEEAGSLRIGLADSLCSALFPTLLQQYHSRCPKVELVLRTCTEPEMFELLDHNEIDLIYTLDHHLTHNGIVHALEVPEPVCIIAPVGHPLAQCAAVTLEQLSHEEFLLTERGMSYRDQLDQRFVAHHLPPLRPFLELGNTEILCSLVEHGLGLSFVPAYAAKPRLQAGRIVQLNVPDCRADVYRQLVYHKDKWVTPPMKAFIELAHH